MPSLPFSGLSGTPAPGTIGLPSDYQQITADPNAFGAGVGAAEKGLGAAFQDASKAAFEIQDRHDQTAAQNAFSALRDKATAASWGDPTNPSAGPGLLTMQGDQAMRAYGPTVDSLKSAQSDIGSTLSPSAQRIYNAQSTRFLGDQFATFDQHRAQAQKQWQITSLDAQAASAQSAAIANSGDPTAFAHNLADQRNAIVTKGSQLGWSPNVIGQQLADATSKTHLAVTARMADVNPQTAWSYYQANKDAFTGQDQVALEGRLRPALLAWGTRDAANNLYAAYGPGTPSGPVPDMIQASATRQGVDPTVALTTAKIESGMGTLPDRPGSQYRGVFQMGDGAWAARGGTAANRGDLPSQVDLGVANLAHSQDLATQATGQPAQGWQTYLVHQQGDAGGPALLRADPNTNAVDALTPAYQGNRAAATAAVVNNGGKTSMTAGQFANLWQSKYQAASAGVPRGAAPAAKPYVFGDSVAAGIQQANGTDGKGIPDATPDAVLDSINATGPNDIRGRNVILSTGIANDPEKIAVVQQQLDSLKARGANVTLVGVGSRPDLAPLNAQLADLAQKNGAAFTGPLATGPDEVSPANYKGLGVPPAQTPGTGSQLATARQNLPGMMDAATRVLDPFGQNNPQFQDQVQSRLRAKVAEQEFAQREAEKGHRETLLNAVMGPTNNPAMPQTIAAGAAPAAGPAPAPPADPNAATMGPPPAMAPPTAPSPTGKPTSLDQLLQDPTVRAAWIASTPETQRSIMQVIEHNARGEDPPLTQAAQTLYYQLSGMATNDRESFQKLNLADPQYLSALPHSMVQMLMSEQHRIGNATVRDAAREETQARALNVLRPDLLAAGVKVSGFVAGDDDAKKYDTFVGRLRENLDTFQQANNRRPNDAEVAKIGQTLLMQGTQRGTANWLPWSSDKQVKAYETDPAQFAPTVPPADRQGITAAWTTRFGRPPTEGEIGEAYMRSRAQAVARQPARILTAPGGPATPTTRPAPLPMAQQQALPPSPPSPSTAPAQPAPGPAATPRGY